MAANSSSIASASAGTSSALGSIGSAVAQADAISAQSAYQSRMLQLNSELAKFQSEDAIRRGNDKAQYVEDAAQRVIGSQRVALAAQGVVVDSGSALDVQENTAALAAQDALTIRNNAWMEAWGYKVSAVNTSGQATLTKLAGQSEATNTILGGINRGISAGIGTISDYYKGKPASGATVLTGKK